VGARGGIHKPPHAHVRDAEAAGYYAQGNRLAPICFKYLVADVFVECAFSSADFRVRIRGLFLLPTRQALYGIAT